MPADARGASSSFGQGGLAVEDQRRIPALEGEAQVMAARCLRAARLRRSSHSVTGMLSGKALSLMFRRQLEGDRIEGLARVVAENPIFPWIATRTP
jgi:hypothetical protein